jgi:hypothetical protein
MLAAAQERISGQVGVERGLELFDQIADRHPPEQLPALSRQTGVASPAGPSAFLEQIVTNTHAHQSAPAL